MRSATPVRRLAFISILALFAACDDEGPSSTLDASVLPDAGDDACAGLADGTPCGVSMICLAQTCGASVCGDGYVDTSLGEECDDGNTVSGDGCEMNCQFSCAADEDCSDGNACNGFETCIAVASGQRCQAGLAPSCEPDVPDPNPCTDYLCDADAETLEAACVVIESALCYEDNDGDGFPNPQITTPTIELCDCPEGYMRARQDGLWDCNDNNAAVRPDTLLSAETLQYHAVPYCADGTLAEISEKPGTCPIVNKVKPPEKAVCPLFVCEDESKPSFDYTCTNRPTPEHTDLADPTRSEGMCFLAKTFCGNEGWIDGWMPPCGATSYVQACSLAHKCDPKEASYSELTQRCR
jgi:cysteine-rich repeat protein